MAEDSYTEVSSQGWFSRIWESIKSVAFGFVLFLVAFPVLFWNEGRAVRTAKSLKEGAGAVVSVSADRVDPGNEGKLVHMNGEATTSETLADPEFGVSLSAIKLERRVEMYQWKEETKSETKKKLGGSEETVKTYSYTKAWADEVIASDRFKKPEGHGNPAAFPVEKRDWSASKVTLGGFTLSPDLVGRLNKAEELRVDEKAAGSIAPAMKDKFKLQGGSYYLGKDPANPAIGDARVSFRVVRPAAVSIVARQIRDTFEAFRAKAGDSILLLTYGTVSADSMFKAEQAANVTLTWILRGVGCFMMAFGLFLVFKPIAVLGDVIPFVGTLLGAGIGLFAGIVALTLSLVTIAIAWLFYRPFLGIALLALAGGAMYGLKYLSDQKKSERAAPSAAA